MASIPIRTHGTNRQKDISKPSTHASDVEYVQRDHHSSKLQTEYICGVCYEAFDTSNKYAIHVLKHDEPKTVTLEVSGEISDFVRETIDHETELRSLSTREYCRMCGEWYDEKCRLGAEEQHAYRRSQRDALEREMELNKGKFDSLQTQIDTLRLRNCNIEGNLAHTELRRKLDGLPP